ncbi:carboxylesterase/lipase family protein [Streptomyces sp. SID7499]|uniref:Carboxylic ester hydrolase n=1 Tax=Streptomyces sp. SID7499 TaxID=2706086 RepID=A0A6G3X8N4_9ACTN|nr:carboxylesterase/lipase family protein [Streptomyces sp. SID7499]
MRTTTAGRVGGVQYRPSGFCLWRGIPYGAIPADGGRFAGPVRPHPWDRVRPALRHGSMSWQLPPVYDKVCDVMREFDFAHTADPEHEDCLNLNVYTPDPGHAGLPVLVWFHPGMQVAGSGNMPGRRPEVLSRNHGVVVVTMNFRLGCWGHLFLDDLLGRDTANLRLRDQLLALTWVKENIAAFGGDAANVTVFGESAGARNIGSLLGCPAADGLFERAALYSGGCENVVPREEATEFAREFLDCAGLTGAPQRILSVPNVHLKVAHQRLLKRRELVHYRDVLDGVHLPRLPIEAMRAGTVSGKVDLLVSHTADEAGLWDRLMPGGARVVAQGARTAAAGTAGYESDHVRFINEELFLRPARDLLRAKAAAGGGRCWYQVYDYVPTDHSFADAERALHGMDLASLLLDVSAPGAASESDVAVARTVQSALVDFASGRVPATDGLTWPVYERGAERLVRIRRRPSVDTAVWPQEDDTAAAGRWRGEDHRW